MSELGQVRFLPLSSVQPSPENDILYRPVDPQDADLRDLAADIAAHGLLEPIVITDDFFILSGHRRHAACRLAGLRDVSCRMMGIRRGDPSFLPTLARFNKQREKTNSERLREEVVTQADPAESYRKLKEHRRASSRLALEGIELREVKDRARLTAAKTPFLNAVNRVLLDLQPFWPVSDRQIHYRLLNAPPLVHASKPGSIYQNTPQCYKALTDIVTRARLAGHIPMRVISDVTRPVAVWDVHISPREFLRSQRKEFLQDYRRDLLQSQPNHIEIIAEKNTLQGILEPVAADYTIPMTIGRGYCSLPPRHALAERFRKSGKEALTLLVLSDFDPDGEEICHSFARSLRDDFALLRVEAIKVALTQEQIGSLSLPANRMQAKQSSTNYARFVGRYGPDVYELEAVPPRTLQEVLRCAVESVLDQDAFNAEVEAEKNDAAFLETERRRVLSMMDQEERE